MGVSTSRRLNPLQLVPARTRGAVWDDLNDVSVASIVSFLPVREVCAFQSTCRRARDATRQKEVWMNLLQSDFGVKSGKGEETSGASGTASTTASTTGMGTGAIRNSLRAISTRINTWQLQSSSSDALYSMYKRRFADHKREERLRAARLQRAQAEGVARVRGRRLRVLLDLFHYPIGVGLPCCMLPAWLILLLLKLDGKLTVPWVTVFMPVWISLGIVFFSLILGCITKLCSNSASSTSAWNNQSDAETYSLFYFASGFVYVQQRLMRVRAPACRSFASSPATPLACTLCRALLQDGGEQ